MGFCHTITIFEKTINLSALLHVFLKHKNIQSENMGTKNTSVPENIQSIPVLPYSSAIVDRVAERHTY